MRKPDVVLLALAFVALVGTAVGVARSDDWTDERTYRFASSTDVVLPDQGPAPAGAAPARLEWVAPDNATGMLAEVTVRFEGQAVQGGTTVIRISGTAPDGTQMPVFTRTLVIAPGATSAEASTAYNATWLEVPGDVRDTREPPGHGWDLPLVLLVTVERPSDAPVANYAFTATVGGRYVTYVLE